jgi:hypothetical protein
MTGGEDIGVATPISVATYTVEARSMEAALACTSAGSPVVREAKIWRTCSPSMEGVHAACAHISM